MLAVSAGIGQGVQIQRADFAILAGTQPDGDFHFMPGRTGNLGFLPGVDELAGAAGFPGDKGGIHLAHRRLLGTEAAADAGLLHPHHALGDAQGGGNDAAAVEHNLGGGNHMEPPVAVHLAVGAEGLHHGLVKGLGVIGMLQHNVAVRHYGVHIAAGGYLAGNQIPLVVAAHRAGGIPVLLGMHQGGVILGGAIVQHGGQQLIGYLNQLHGFQGCLLVLGGNDGNHIAHEANVAVDDQTVIGGRLGIGLTGNGKAMGGHILPGVNIHHARHLLGNGGVNLFHQGVGVGAAQQLDHQRLPGDIIGVHRLAQQQLHGVLFADGLTNGFQFFFHYFTPRLFRNARMPRSCPS